MLSNGSSGSEVRKLQQSLVDAGYDVGGVDGIYGSNTESAVRKYQQANGLAVDGIAGDETLGSLYAPKATATPQTTQTTAATPAPTQTTTPSAAPQATTPSYDAAANEAYMQAIAALQQAQDAVPSYAGTYDAQLQELYNQIVNRDKFSYDINSDALYQQYKDQYTTQGRLAMMDTMGQAAALTGGYGSSYAQSVGQQQYQAYLQQLNEVVPELYGMARDQYNAEGDALINQYAMLGDMADTEYGRYQDSLNQYWQNLNYLKGQADDAYDRGYTNWYNEYQMGVDADERNYSRQQDAYDRLVSLMTSTGYTPTAAELQAAGMSSGQAQAYANYYAQQNGLVSGSGGSSSGGGSGGKENVGDTGDSWDGSKYSKNVIKLAQELVGTDVDGAWGPKSTAAAKAAGYDSLADVVYQLNVNSGNPYFAGGNDDTVDFNGTTKSEAVAYMLEQGVPNNQAAFILGEYEFRRARATDSDRGVLGRKASEFESYEEYLAYAVYALVNSSTSGGGGSSGGF